MERITAEPRAQLGEKLKEVEETLDGGVRVVALHSWDWSRMDCFFLLCPNH